MISDTFWISVSYLVHVFITSICNIYKALTRKQNFLSLTIFWWIQLCIWTMESDINRCCSFNSCPDLFFACSHILFKCTRFNLHIYSYLSTFIFLTHNKALSFFQLPLFIMSYNDIIDIHAGIAICFAFVTFKSWTSLSLHFVHNDWFCLMMIDSMS